MNSQDIKRLRRLRRRFLELVDAAKAAGGIRGRSLADILENNGDFIDCLESLPGMTSADKLAINLGADLANGGYITRQDVRKHREEREGLDFYIYTVTAKGTALLQEAIAPDAFIEDARFPIE